MTALVDVQFAVQDDSMPSTEVIIEWIDRTICATGSDAQSEVAVRIVDGLEIRKLNKEYRQQDKETNVLSFPAGVVSGLPADVAPPMGDIIICASVVNKEAAEQGKSPSDHWAHMVIHGALHLLGFDHENDADAEVMEGLEIQILTAHGIANPYTI